jgi:uncharacterized protein (TIGR02246 family)
MKNEKVKTKYIRRKMMNRGIYLAFLISIALSAALWAGETETGTIREIMDRQVTAWNNGDLEGFMGGYWHSDDLTFQSGNKRLKGWNTLLEMYQKNYSGENRGILEFTDIEMKVLSDELILVLGRWSVARNQSKSEGLFTLVFRRMETNWKIIHDHSS